MQYKVLFKRCLLAIVVMFVVTSLQAQREMKTINDNNFVVDKHLY